MVIDFNSDELITVHLSLVSTGVIGAVILLKIYLEEYVPSEAEGMKLKVFNIIKRINESKTLNSNSDNCPCKYKKPMKHWACGEDCVWNPSACVCKCDKNCDIAL